MRSGRVGSTMFLASPANVDLPEPCGPVTKSPMRSALGCSIIGSQHASCATRSSSQPSTAFRPSSRSAGAAPTSGGANGIVHDVRVNVGTSLCSIIQPPGEMRTRVQLASPRSTSQSPSSAMAYRSDSGTIVWRASACSSCSATLRCASVSAMPADFTTSSAQNSASRPSSGIVSITVCRPSNLRRPAYGRLSSRPTPTHASRSRSRLYTRSAARPSDGCLPPSTDLSCVTAAGGSGSGAAGGAVVAGFAVLSGEIVAFAAAVSSRKRSSDGMPSAAIGGFNSDRAAISSTSEDCAFFGSSMITGSTATAALFAVVADVPRTSWMRATMAPRSSVDGFRCRPSASARPGTFERSHGQPTRRSRCEPSSLRASRTRSSTTELPPAAAISPISAGMSCHGQPATSSTRAIGCGRKCRWPSHWAHAAPASSTSCARFCHRSSLQDMGDDSGVGSASDVVRNAASGSGGRCWSSHASE